jgi:hypothetical protein
MCVSFFSIFTSVFNMDISLKFFKRYGNESHASQDLIGG